MMEAKFMSEESRLHQEIIEWGSKCLLSLGYTLKINIPENVLNTPWSYLVRFKTSAGYIYLKHNPKLFALEPSIIQILGEKFQASVPSIIAQNDELNCFLMKDAGQNLRSILKKKFDTRLLFKTIEQFTSLQIAVADHIDLFFNIGVPDYRLDKLAQLYQELISDHDLLREEGLSIAEIKVLEARVPNISSVCNKLSAYGIKETIVQPDFNDNNTLVDDKYQKVTLIDLGEIVISHPFFSLLNCFDQIKKHHDLKEEDAVYLKLKDLYFKNYRNCFESEEHLKAAIELAKLLLVVYEVAYQYRFMCACSKGKLVAFQHWKLSDLLKEFMTLDSFKA